MDTLFKLFLKAIMLYQGALFRPWNDKLCTTTFTLRLSLVYDDDVFPCSADFRLRSGTDSSHLMGCRL
jgi:hypothetical protein